jgi:hypothetical protein
VKQLLFVAVVTAFLIVLWGYTPAGAAGERGMIYLAQQTEESTDKQSETPRAEASDEAETEGEDDDDTMTMTSTMTMMNMQSKETSN